MASRHRSARRPAGRRAAVRWQSIVVVSAGLMLAALLLHGGPPADRLQAPPALRPPVASAAGGAPRGPAVPPLPRDLQPASARPRPVAQPIAGATARRPRPGRDAGGRAAAACGDCGSHGAAGGRAAVGPKVVARGVQHNMIVVGLGDLVRRADRIVRGRVKRSEVRWGQVGGRRAIFTFHTLTVAQTLKGPPAREVVVRVIGGHIREENVGLRVSHQPELSRGDEGFVFLSDDPTRWTAVVGGPQGVLRTGSRGPDDGQVSDGFGRRIVGLTGDERFVVGGAPRDALAPRELGDAIRRLAR